MKKILLVFLLFCFGNSFSQILEGYIFDKNSETPLQSATVYLDGTTISTLTDSEGYFKLNSKGNVKSDLVISYIGYKTARLANPFQYKKIKTFLEEDAIGIDEVVIGKSPFTRKSMMKAFKNQFLGSTKAASSCKILNEDDINLYYDIDTNILSATSRNPIKIKNNYLGYEVNFDLVDFTLEFKVRSLDMHYLAKSYFAGTTFYKDISKPKKSDAKRREAYLGSAIHFMNTVANESWKEEKFGLYVDKFPSDPKEYFRISDTLGIKKITVLKTPITKMEQGKDKGFTFTSNSTSEPLKIGEKKIYFNVLYDGKKQSIVDFVSKEYYVDANGNYSPFYDVMFGGYIGTLKAGDMLPTDYFQTIKAQK